LLAAPILDPADDAGFDDDLMAVFFIRRHPESGSRYMGCVQYMRPNGCVTLTGYTPADTVAITNRHLADQGWSDGPMSTSSTEPRMRTGAVAPVSTGIARGKRARGIRFFRSPEEVAASRANKAAWSRFFAILPHLTVEGDWVWFAWAERRAK
jgi:hypothetical protein